MKNEAKEIDEGYNERAIKEMMRKKTNGEVDIPVDLLKELGRSKLSMLTNPTEFTKPQKGESIFSKLLLLHYKRSSKSLCIAVAKRQYFTKKRPLLKSNLSLI